MSDTPADAIADALPKRLRARRKEVGKTLQQVADHTGLSVGFLSQIERGLSTPSLASLAAIARALDCSPDHFVALPDPGAAESRAARRTARSLGDGTVRYQRLSRSFPGSRLNSVLMTLPPGHVSRPSRHDGEELVFVVRGVVLSTVDGERRLLEPGDSVHFDSGRKHNLKNIGDEPAEVLWVGTLRLFGEDKE